MGNGEKSLYTFRAMITIGHSRAGGNPDSMVLDGGVMRMKKLFITILSVAVIFGLLDTIQAHLDHRLYDLQQNKEMLMSDAIVELKKNRVILVGEHQSIPSLRPVERDSVTQGGRCPGGHRARNV
jgi:hypothetical protein